MNAKLLSATTVFCIFAVVSAYPAASDVVEISDGFGEIENGHYFLVPVRAKRQTTVDVKSANPGALVTLQHQGTILNNNGHRLDGTASLSKQFNPSGPASIGGGLNYNHIPSGSNLNVGAQHTPHFGTDLSAKGNANLWRRGNSRLDAVGSYQRHFGGAGGTSHHPNYYGGLKLTHRF